MVNKKIFKLQANVSKALGHPLRMEIIHLLKNKEESFSYLLEATGCLKSNLSQHLKLLTENGILKVRRESQCSYFSLTSKKVAEACSLMKEVLLENLEEQQEILKKIYV
ncbi:helix-turn-helix transcriptional regulator [Antarcticibacterium flavum]|uniref:Helix-turn-helix transcriptional regulator n=1 Tax=Antarcticibacterium flavum TaxID=2058175 RepID=A0A5B7WZ44_9FLAO|nr:MULTISPECIES: metalloregulator ArsR/SmtB family transcription factor [Antarcticibacterium]MCM4158639.1 ArsR family transcriptional regulator [Antarcticibacterium sp. W02-3]QCY68494.1 helix-turn-helix transcriptional regulator [Antarcticibacterium flavum]